MTHTLLLPPAAVAAWLTDVVFACNMDSIHVTVLVLILATFWGQNAQERKVVDVTYGSLSPFCKCHINIQSISLKLSYNSSCF